MRIDPLLKPVVLMTLPTEGMAATIVGVLESEGVRAWAMGGTPMEGANVVRIMVLSADMDLANAVLETVRAEAQAIDWDSVDVNPADLPDAAPHAEESDPLLSAPAGGSDRGGSRLSLGGLGTAGAGAGLIGMQDVLFAALPTVAKPVPGCALVTAGVVWCVAKARRNKAS